MLNLLDRFVAGIGFWTAAVALPATICVRLYKIVARKVFGVPSNIPQYLEWELFLLLVFLTLGYGYARGAHVRLDIIRDRLGPLIRDRIELVGLLLLIVPFVLVICYFGIPYALESYNSGEKSALALGAPARWR